MTNFTPSSKARSFEWLSPERAVLVLPIFGGLLLSFVVFATVLTPLSLQLKQQQDELNGFAAKSAQVPSLRQQLLQMQNQQLMRRMQQERLLALVAGTSQLSTFLAELNDLALTHKVQIMATEPGPITRFQPPPPPQPASTESPPSPAATSEAAQPPADQLLYEGVEKRSAKLRVVGTFPHAFAFLQALERLQIFVVITDLEVNLDSSLQLKSKDVPAVVSMAMTVTAYGREASQAGRTQMP